MLHDDIPLFAVFLVEADRLFKNLEPEA